MTTTEKPTTPTKYGPAEFRVSPDGLLSLHWFSVSINRVTYRSANVYQRRNRYDGPDSRPFTECAIYRVDGKTTTDAAYTAFRAELARLVPLLVTPEACARARAEEARAELTRCEKATQEAQDAEARARAELAAAVAALVQFEDGAA